MYMDIFFNSVCVIIDYIVDGFMISVYVCFSNY